MPLQHAKARGCKTRAAEGHHSLLSGPRVGLERTLKNIGKTGNSKKRAAKSGANLTDPRLAKLIGAWPSLPDPIRRAILALVDAV